MDERADPLERAMPSPPSRAAAAALRERLTRTFGELFRKSVPFKEDAALVERLEREAGPVLEVLLSAFAAGEPPGASLHEGYALLTQLAGKAGSLGCTPTAALALARAIASALAGAGAPLSEAAAHALTATVFEGYCAAREEQVVAELRRSAAEAQPWLEIAPGCFAVCLSGRQRADELAPVLGARARDLLRRDARSCVLHIAGLEGDDDLLRSVGHFSAELRIVGVALFVSGSDERLRERFADWSIAPRFCASFEEALSHALARCDHELRRSGAWKRWLRRGRAEP